MNEPKNINTETNTEQNNLWKTISDLGLVIVGLTANLQKLLLGMGKDINAACGTLVAISLLITVDTNQGQDVCEAAEAMKRYVTTIEPHYKHKLKQ